VKLFVGGSPLVIDVRKSLGKGMEADVYRVGDRAVKVFKDPSHPDLLTDFDREAARRKIEEHQSKLPQFPKRLPPRVVAPVDLVSDQSGRIVGYTMRLVENPRQARAFGDVGERLNGLDPNQVVAFMLDLHGTVGGLHGRGVVVGDFNDLNVLVSGGEAHVIDADSFQYGAFLCRMYTEEFVDPRLCDPDGNSPVLREYHDENSDWYAYAAMLFKLLLCVGPFGGVYRPSRRRDAVLHTQRPLKGITVFNPEVTYPKKAVHFRLLPDDILHHFQSVFERGVRAEFPRGLLAGMRWTTCRSCGVVHARGSCPDCQAATPAAIRETVEAKGKIRSTTVFRTSGRILHASMQGGRLRWLYAEGGKFMREDQRTAFSGTPDPGMRYRLHGDDTIVGRGSSVVVVRKDAAPAQLVVDQFRGGALMFDASEAGVFWQQGGSIMRGNRLGLEYEPERVGQVLEGQTLFWVGPQFGFGFYRAGDVSVSFVFDAAGRSLNDSVQVPRMGGQLVAAKCFFGPGRAAAMFSYKDGPRVTNRCVLVKANGEVAGVAEAQDGDGSWLGGIGGKCVVGDSVLSATDDGLVKVDFSGGAAARETRFDGSDAFVDAGSHLFAATDGLYCVGDGKVSLLQLRG